jgi:hypothetical protein
VEYTLIVSKGTITEWGIPYRRNMNKMNNKRYNSVGTMPNSNRKSLRKRDRYPLHSYSLSCLDTDNSDGAKLILYAHPIPHLCPP